MDNYSRIQYQQRSNKAHKLAIYIGLLLLLLFALASYLYLVMFPINSTASKYAAAAKREAGIKSVKTFKESDRNGHYYSIYGADAQGNNYLTIFNHQEKLVDKIPVSRQLSNAKLDQIYVKYAVKHVYSFSPSVYKGRPVFEISYQGGKSSVNYLTIDLRSGKVYRIIEGI
ncbi:hypothetical protein DLJ48_08255 [Oenococcus sicerae]|uniref:DUF5590 domain-containing protein n=1 Tax=Oenococcus sicerae TaxID=2203724 RepID=A0AAJ1VQ56_9LACO|nr:hypothetical protein [Oenococcus sicerae]MDN6899827.1 hypothetical protein [Oenococcus sicerae]QAS70513.1 hypothetical protein DLJ48_08255 [Oenococcus sicerae]